MATTASSLSATIIHINHKPKTPCYHIPTSTNISSYQPLISSLTLSNQKNLIHFHTPIRRHTCLRASASEDAATNIIPTETAQEIVSSTGDDGVYNIISILLFIAFLALSILTIGVVYISVTDFLQKREKDKFEKEEAAKKKKKSGKKVKARASAGPRGFGQKIDEDDD